MKHYLRYHDGEDPDEMKMGMKIHTFRKSAFERQVAEAVTIQQVQKNHHLMNSKSEYRACKIPRITIKMGDTEMYEETERRRREQREDDELEARIKTMRRMSQKRRMEEETIQQRKRARLTHDWRTLKEEKMGNTKRDDKANKRTNEGGGDEEIDITIDPEKNLDDILTILEEEDRNKEVKYSPEMTKNSLLNEKSMERERHDQKKTRRRCTQP